MLKANRIAYNGNGWRSPTGDASRLEQQETFNSVNGFGYEDWLFRDEWEVDGWRYSFLQGVNKSYAKLIRENQSFDVVLFTIRPTKERQYIAYISEMECLSELQATEALKIFKSNGWFDTMKAEVQSVGGDSASLDTSPYTSSILNVRFRRSSVQFYPSSTFAGKSDPMRRWGRYNLIDITAASRAIETRSRAGSTLLPSAMTYMRSSTTSVQVSPEHARMQAELMIHLRSRFPNDDIIREQNYIDVLVETEQERWLYEIKSDLNPRSVLRQAIGQLLEYAHFAVIADHRKVHLVAVGRKALSPEDDRYLKRLQGEFSLPLHYLVVTI